jgi:hypothetical protein
MANIIYPSDFSQARSPMFLQCEPDTAGETITDAVHSISLYTGDKSTGAPAQAQVQLSKLSVDGKVLTNVSEIVRAYFVQNYTSHNAPGASTYYIAQAVGAALWVKVSTATTESDGGYTEDSTFLAMDGYTEFEDGLNATHSETILTAPRTINLLPGQYFNLPVKNNPRIEWRLNDGVTPSSWNAAPAHGDDTDKQVVYIPIGRPNLNSVTDLTLDIYAAKSGFTVEVRDESTDEDLGSINVAYICEPKYEGHYIAFLNKWGVWDTMVFEKKSVKDMTVQSEGYKRIIGTWGARADDGTRPYTYNTREGVHARINAIGQERITLNTGLIGEEYNEVVRQLLQSEAFLMDNSVPVVLESASVTYKDEVNELVNYTLIFTYAHTAINRTQ